MGEISFSFLTQNDIEAVLKIEKASFPSPWSRGMFMADLMKKDMAFFIVARLDNRIVGYGGFWLVLDEGHLGNLAVHPEFRRQGIGEKLLNELIKIAKSKKAEMMTLEVRETNQAARQLYEKMGFRVVAIRKKYYVDTDEDAYVYIKDEL
jgi:ribosomal-protein-alanine N-acetyltransferase